MEIYHVNQEPSNKIYLEHVRANLHTPEVVVGPQKTNFVSYDVVRT